jgi:hypothetical protein
MATGDLTRNRTGGLFARVALAAALMIGAWTMTPAMTARAEEGEKPVARDYTRVKGGVAPRNQTREQARIKS